MIELRHLRTLQTLRDSGSLTAAAQQLHQTQSALSHQLNELEQRLGHPLFIRKTRPVKFTPQGEQLLTLASSILPQVSLVEEALRQHNTALRPALALAIECHSCIQWLMPTLTRFGQEAPQTEVRFTAATAFDPQPRLLQGELDMVITSDVQARAGIYYAPLFDFEIRWVMAPQHRLATHATVDAAELQDERLLVYPVPKQRLDIWRYVLQPEQITPTLKPVENTLLQLQMVAAGMGIAALPHWAVFDAEQQGLLCSRQIGDKGLWRRLYLAVRENERSDPAISHFLHCAREQTAFLPHCRAV
ncbi:LysR family transcriptional regulator [Plesiomonas shigelloides]|uniref:LysR substrate-binding domain-containing protein n=1 Tax=Plesiomonas shigelloides TaxID=703 RepID=UPI001261AA1C|nr:LysR family transcriptional regulator [Plesiomonas shigelloides]